MKAPSEEEGGIITQWSKVVNEEIGELASASASN